MNLTDQTLSGVNEICLTDSINASLLKLAVKMGVNTVVPSSNDLIIYVDKTPSSNPTTDRKQYVFNLNSSLKYYENSGDEFIEQIKIINNDVMFKTSVNRVVGDSGDYILENIVEEELESIPITLFEGVNYIYTNYSNANITLTYPKNDDLNNMFLNNAIYSENKNNNSISLDDLYFKDAFTKTEDNLNLEVDNANISCLTSKNNKFSLDSDGNLIVNSISNNQGIINNNEMYPIGSIYLSVNSTNPTTLFGGVWEQISGYYLYAGTGGTTAGNNTSGEPSTNTTGNTFLSINQIPSHSHTLTKTAISMGINEVDGLAGGLAWSDVHIGGSNTTNNTGGNQGHTHTLSSHTHSIQPLRYEVYMWKRIA